MRIVAISDQHGYLPAIPSADLLIIAGDVCPDHVSDGVRTAAQPDEQARWLDGPFREWVTAIPLPPDRKIVTWGNHDFVAERADLREHFERDLPVTLGMDVLVEAAGLTIWITPWSNTFQNWALMKSPEELETIYAAVPVGLDILVSHQPPFGYGDLENVGDGRLDHVGSHELLATLERTRPRALVCGHIHRAFGRFAHGGIPIFNVSVCDEHYDLAHAPTRVELIASTHAE
jgi:Icc-related predicted phosphoesterase